MTTASGQYWQSTIGRAIRLPQSADQLIAPNERFGFIFGADGDAQRFVGFLDLDDPDRPVFEDYWRWTVDADGLVQMEGLRTSTATERCVPTVASCVAWRIRQWRPVKIQDDFLYVLEDSIRIPFGTTFHEAT
ncbi:MAG: hypothetical protein AAF449_15465, partial [Myxococcota bacterium]